MKKTFVIAALIALLVPVAAQSQDATRASSRHELTLRLGYNSAGYEMKNSPLISFDHVLEYTYYFGQNVGLVVAMNNMYSNRTDTYSETDSRIELNTSYRTMMEVGVKGKMTSGAFYGVGSLRGGLLGDFVSYWRKDISKPQSSLRCALLLTGIVEVGIHINDHCDLGLYARGDCYGAVAEKTLGWGVGISCSFKL